MATLNVSVRKGSEPFVTNLDLKKAPSTTIIVDNLVKIEYAAQVLHLRNTTSGAEIVTLDLSEPKNPKFAIDANNFPVVRPSNATKPKKPAAPKEGGEAAKKKNKPEKRKAEEDAAVEKKKTTPAKKKPKTEASGSAPGGVLDINDLALYSFDA